MFKLGLNDRMTTHFPPLSSQTFQLVSMIIFSLCASSNNKFLFLNFFNILARKLSDIHQTCAKLSSHLLYFKEKILYHKMFQNA